MNGEITAYFTILNGIVEKRVFETLRKFRVDGSSQ